ncbi:NADH-quinone oxidoreductase subunit NuoF [Buchnera aphidicola (Kurisakia onigurumii)]|uniref:NADH-quinone oxidoreductase subunit NuoF n=1 Tax=Buchnera aphidicola TaxID=9 RepID=UPI0031B70B36
MKRNILLPDTHPLTWRNRKDKKPVWIDEYRNKNGYVSLEKIFYENFSPEYIINLIKNSGLKGRGGAGFLTGLKWSLLNDVNDDKQRYLICNADEMEPGTYKDRFLMERIPHLLIEGIIISAFALQVSIAYIFLRGEYFKSENFLNRSITEAYENNYLGKNILNSNFTLNLYVHSGAGRYICGEETALINSLEGNRPNPRLKPPFPASIGLWGQPTCVNNVETLCNIPAIILYGNDWYNNLSNGENSAGTKLMGFSGQVNNPGIWELPFGITARELLEDYAQGMRKGFILKSWQPGGASTDFLLEKHLDVKMDFDSIKKIGSRLGTALCMAVDSNINMVALVLNIEEFFSRESCGLCTPCRSGLPWIVNILKNIYKKNGKLKDIQYLEDLCITLGPGKTVCALAPGAIEPLQSALKYFRHEFEQLIQNK